MKKIYQKIFRLMTILQLRSKYFKRGIDLLKLSHTLGLDVELSLDLGSGPMPKNPFNAVDVFGVDIRSYDINSKVKKCSIGSQDLPFEDNQFDVVTAFDVLEHIPRASISGAKTIFPFVEAMNQVWRVLKPGGLFYSQTPCYPMKEAFQDPTHVNIMTEDTLRLYFGERAWARIYGFKGSFRLVSEGWTGSHYCCVLQKIDEIPNDDINTPQK
jgi:SAM-dependent methyltransferase